jgi:molecular chaperone GrpE
MTEADDIITNGTDGVGEQPAGSGSSTDRTTSDSAEQAEKPRESRDNPSVPAGADGEVVEEELDELASALAERDEFKDLALRAKADFENYRKRADKRVAETRTVAVAAVIRELLPVIDNLDRAVGAAGETAEGDAFAEGVRMVHADLHSVLDRIGLTQLDPAGDTFDPNLHEAVSQAPAGEQAAAGTIVEVVQKGFQLGEIVVRPARVVVAA